MKKGLFGSLIKLSNAFLEIPLDKSLIEYDGELNKVTIPPLSISMATTAPRRPFKALFAAIWEFKSKEVKILLPSVGVIWLISSNNFPLASTS